MTTELAIGAINPGYGGLPIGVAAALGGAQLAFIEWMMGLPVGYVSTPSLPLTRADRMMLLQTGTVPLQAAHAVAVGLTQIGEQ